MTRNPHNPGIIGDQDDGGFGGLGRVLDVSPDSTRSSAILTVGWRRTGKIRTYRWGSLGVRHQGAYDVAVATVPSLSGTLPALPVGALVLRSLEHPKDRRNQDNHGLGIVLSPEPGLIRDGLPAGWVKVEWIGSETRSEARWGLGGVHELDVVSCFPGDTQCDRCGLSIAFKRRLLWRCLDCVNCTCCDEARRS